MKNLGHGADVEYLSSLYNKNSEDILDFSSNINPRVVTGIEKYLLEGLSKCTKYPDINYSDLKNNISSYLNVAQEFIIPGNGATEIIYLLMKSIGKRIAIINPTFSEYERAASLNGLDVVNFYLNPEGDFLLDLEYIRSNLNNFDSLFICNPNNPSGNVQNIEKLMELLKENGKLLIVDETFMEFVEKENEYSLVKYTKENQNIFILKAATKFFGLPGIRLGYGICSNEEIINEIYRYKEPWTVNSIADYISNFIFSDKEYIKESKTSCNNEKEFMLSNLRKIDGIKVFDTDTNFILIKLLFNKSHEIKRRIFEDFGILIRDASNFRGLDDSYIRLAIKSREDNLKMIKSLESVVN